MEGALALLLRNLSSSTPQVGVNPFNSGQKNSDSSSFDRVIELCVRATETQTRRKLPLNPRASA